MSPNKHLPFPSYAVISHHPLPTPKPLTYPNQPPWLGGLHTKQATVVWTGRREEEEDSLNSIQNSIANVQLANNANPQQMNDNLSAMTEETRHNSVPSSNSANTECANSHHAIISSTNASSIHCPPPVYIPVQAPPPTQCTFNKYACKHVPEGGCWEGTKGT